VIEATSSHPDVFSDSDERTMTTVARQLATVVENARRHQEIEKQLAEISTLYQLAQQINTSLNTQEVLDSIVWSLKQALGCRGCSIALLDPVKNMLEIRTAAGVEYKWERAFKLRLGEGIAGRVALEGTPIYVPDVSEQDDFIFFDRSVRSLLTVPLTLQQRIIGTLTIDSNQPYAFRKSDERLLTIAATQAAIAIENARLYAGLEQRAQHLAEAYAELKQADRLKDEIAQNVSHELRTPLTFVKSYVELLLDDDTGPLTTEQKKYLKIVVDKINVVTKLVDDIMALQQAEQAPARREPVSLTELARQVVQGHTAIAEKAGSTLVENLPDDLSPVAGDKDKLLQVFDHLLTNAIKFSPSHGQITVTVEDAGPMLQASVSDQGIGIPKDQQERIFERFYQINGSARRRFGGAGMGLAIVKRILEAHDGQVWVESELGKGSTFYIMVPKYQEPQVN
jgi:signal transduction histidine kinase